MALTGISLVETVEFRSSFDDAPEEQKSVFKIGAIDAMVRASIQDNATSWIPTESGMQLVNKSAYRNYECVRFGLKEIVSNYRDPSGNDIKLEFVNRQIGTKSYKVVADSTLSTFPGAVIAEMAEKIIEINTMGDELRKK